MTTMTTTNTRYSDIQYISGYDCWRDMWIADKRGSLATMLRNIAADLDAGYNPIGDNVRRQIEDATAYRHAVDRREREIEYLPSDKRERAYYNDLIKTGAID